jgi:hypothetical protein
VTAQVAADLRAAAEVLRRDGWTQEVFCDPSTGSRCAQGALDAVYAPRERDGSYDESAEDAAYAQVCAVIGTNRLISWNDEPGRTAEEVIAALEAAADAAEVDQ